MVCYGVCMYGQNELGAKMRKQNKVMAALAAMVCCMLAFSFTFGLAGCGSQDAGLEDEVDPERSSKCRVSGEPGSQALGGTWRSEWG